jgi:hypothetical protein
MGEIGGAKWNWGVAKVKVVDAGLPMEDMEEQRRMCGVSRMSIHRQDAKVD